MPFYISVNNDQTKKGQITYNNDAEITMISDRWSLAGTRCRETRSHSGTLGMVKSQIPIQAPKDQ